MSGLEAAWPSGSAGGVSPAPPPSAVRTEPGRGRAGGLGSLPPGLKLPGQAGPAVWGSALPPEPARGLVGSGQLSCLRDCSSEPGPWVGVG